MRFLSSHAALFPALLGILLVWAAGCEKELEREPLPPDDSLLTLEKAYAKQKLSKDGPAQYRFRANRRGAYLIVVSHNPRNVPIKIEHPKGTCYIDGNGSCELVSSPDEDYDVHISTDSLEEVVFTLTVSHSEGKGYFEGEVSEPVGLGVEQRHSGTIGVKESSFYAFTTGDGGAYTIDLSATRSNLVWRLFNTPVFDVVLQECDLNGGAANEACRTPRLDPNTRYYVKVEEKSGVPGSYDLSIHGN